MAREANNLPRQNIMAKKIEQNTKVEEGQEAQAGGSGDIAVTFLQPQAPEGHFHMWDEEGRAHVIKFTSEGYTTSDAKEIERLRGAAKYGIVEKE